MASKRKKAHYECKQKVCCLSSEEIDVDFREAKLPRQKPSTRRLGTVQASCENTVFSVENYNKVNNYIPALDRIISEFKSRFAENDSFVLCALTRDKKG